MFRLARVLIGLCFSLGFAFASPVSAQVFYPQYPSVPVSPMPDNLDLSLEVEAFTTNWGEGFTGVSVGAELELDLSPSVTLELDGRRLDTNMGAGYTYGAGLNLHGPRGELYASINSIALDGDLPDLSDKTTLEMGGEYIVNRNLRVGFDGVATFAGALVPYESIYSTNALNQYR